MFSAHWDHFGVGEPIHGDAIYNGAQDNGTGCGILLELARAWPRCHRNPNVRRCSSRYRRKRPDYWVRNITASIR